MPSPPHRWPSPSALMPFAWNVCALIVFSLIVFPLHPGRLFGGNDGPTSISVAQEQRTYFGLSPNLHSNVLEGLGNLSHGAVNFAITPGYWFAAYRVSEFTPTASYIFFSLVTFLATTLVAWNYGASRNMRYGAAWLLTLLFMPYFKHISIYPLPSGWPEITMILLLTAMANVALHRGGSGGWKPTMAFGVLLLFTLYLGLVVMPVYLVSMVPYLFLCTLFSILRAQERTEVISKLAMCAGVLVIAVLLHWTDYLLGLVEYTASNVFAGQDGQPEFIGAAKASLLFQSDMWGVSYMGPWLFLCATLGAVLAIRRKENTLALSGYLLVAVQCLAAGLGGALMAWGNIGNGPVLEFYEIPAFPLYAMFAAYAASRLLAGVAARSAVLSAWFARPYAMEVALIAFLISVCTYQTLYASDQTRANRSSVDYAVPPASVAQTRTLEDTIALRPGATFAGRVVSMIPGLGFRQQWRYFATLNNLIGNDCQTTGLWLKGIPTLHEYSEILTPGFFWLFEHFLSASGVGQIRNWSNFSAINLPMLRLLGVRFILLPKQGGDAQAPRRSGLLTKREPALQLLEIEGANVAGISAHDIVTVPTLDKAAEVMGTRDFDAGRAVVVAARAPLMQKLVAAQESQIWVEEGGFHLRASSHGQTLLILPVEFSECLEVTVLAGAMPRLMRVDGALTGVLFDKDVDIRFAQSIGPFLHPSCRLQDYHEFMQILKGGA